tara:strand:- start:19648 stop:20445 length:798 start_codon:yes stop_codon:yes gene_type:complete
MSKNILPSPISISNFANVSKSVQKNNTKQFNYNDIIDLMKERSNEIDTNQNNINFEKLKQITDSTTQGEILWNILSTQYHYCTDMIELFDSELKKKRDIYNEKNKHINTFEEMLKKKTDVNTTNKRDFELNKYTYDKKRNHLAFFKICLIALGVLMILPILRYLNFITKGLGFLLFFFVVILVLMYGVYMIKIDDKNRDTKIYDRYKFKTPTQKDIYNTLLDNQDNNSKCSQPEQNKVENNMFHKYLDKSDTSKASNTLLDTCNN